jgi:hypothetical protein
VGIIDVGGKILQFDHCLWAFFAQSHIDGLDAKVTGDSDGTIDIVAKAFKQFCCLSFDDVGLLLITGVQS